MNTNEKMQPVQNQPGFLRVIEGFEDHPNCLCGPDVMKDSFWPCDKTGELVYPVVDTPECILCQYFGRIFNADSLELIGKRNVENFGDEFDKIYG